MIYLYKYTLLGHGMSSRVPANSFQQVETRRWCWHKKPASAVCLCRRILFKPWWTTMLGHARILGGILVGSVVSEYRRNRSDQSRVQHWNRHVVLFSLHVCKPKKYNAALKPSIPPAVLVDACLRNTQTHTDTDAVIIHTTIISVPSLRVWLLEITCGTKPVWPVRGNCQRSRWIYMGGSDKQQARLVRPTLPNLYHQFVYLYVYPNEQVVQNCITCIH